MVKEYRIRIIDIDLDETIKYIQKQGGTLIHNWKRYERSIFSRCGSNKASYARIKDENGNVKITVKIFHGSNDLTRFNTLPERYDITIKEDFNTGKQLLKGLGLKEMASQEAYRQKWQMPINGVHEVVLDITPGIPFYMEIECDSKDTLDKLIVLLRVDKQKIRQGSFVRLYNEYYNTPLNEYFPSLTFKHIEDEITPIKNKELLENISKKHRKYITDNIISHKNKLKS